MHSPSMQLTSLSPFLWPYVLQSRKLDCFGLRPVLFSSAPGSRHSQCARTFAADPGSAHLLIINSSHGRSAVPTLVLADLGESISQALFGISQQMDALVQQQLTGVSPLTFVVVLAAGLLTSLSPCTLSVLPLTIGYIGGYSDAGQRASSSSLVSRAAVFAFGLATTLALLGVGSSLLGKSYGQIGSGLPIAVSIVAIVMGLNLLEVLQLQLPSMDLDVRKFSAPPLVQAYLAGLTFALVASPCSTPVLATLLAYVSATQDPLLGGALLITYTTGYVGPLLIVATFAGALKQVMSLRQWSGWITPASGVLLLAGGTYGLLSRVVPV